MNISITSTSFNDIINDLNNDPNFADMPFFLKAAFAGIFYLLSVRINITGNELLVTKVKARDVAEELFAGRDYLLKGYGASTVSIDITIDPSYTVSSTYTISASNLKAKTKQSETLTQIQFEGLANLTFGIGQSTGVFTAVSKETVSNLAIGTTDGTANQILDIPNVSKILKDYTTLVIDSTTYYPVDTFAYSLSTDPHFKLYTREDGSSYIQLGGFIDILSGTQYGLQPAANKTVYVNYAFGGGDDSNRAANTITVYAGSDPAVLTVNNLTAASGGQDPENLENAKTLAQMLSSTHNMAWDTRSVEAIARNVTGVLKAQAQNNGIMSCAVYVMPYGGGSASPTLLSSVASAVLAKSYFQSLTINAYSFTYIPVALYANYTVAAGADPVKVLGYSKLFLIWRTHELSEYIYSVYLSNGLTSALTQINLYFTPITGDTYTSDDAVYIDRMVNKIPYNRVGQTVQVNDLSTAAMAYVDGLQYITITPYTAPPISSGQVLKPASVTLTRV